MITIEDTMSVASLLTPAILAMLAEEHEETPPPPPSMNPINEVEWEQMRHGVIPLHARCWAIARLGYIPTNFGQRLAKATQEAEWFTPSTAVATVFSVIDEETRLKAFKEEQRLIRQANNSMTGLAKVTNGKWDDAWVREWPPLVQSNGTGLKHVPSRYVVKLPDGTRVDMGAPQGRLGGMLHETPTAALQSVCTRLGKRVAGSFEKVLNLLAGGTETNGIPTYVPSQMTVLHRNVWTVVMTVMRNPKLALSAFAQDASGALVPVDGRNESERLTITRFTHAVISAPSVEWSDGQAEGADDDDWQARAISHADAKVVDIEEPEEFNPGRAMLNEACTFIGRSWELLTGSEEHTRPEFRLGLAEQAKQAIKQRRHHKRYAKALYKAWSQPAVSKDTKAALWKAFQRQQRLAREVVQDYREAKEQMFDELANPDPVYFSKEKFTLKPRKRDGTWTRPVQEPLGWDARRTLMPANEIERPVLRNADTKPQGRTGAILKAPYGVTVVTGANSSHVMPAKPVERLTYRTLSTRARLVANALMRKDSIDLALAETRRVERRLAWS